MNRLLITGVDGALAHNLALALAEDFDVCGVCSPGFLEHDKLQLLASPADQPARLAELVADHHPDWIIHCGPLSATSWDVPPAESSLAAAPAVAAALAEVASKLGSRLTVISSDAVFAGPRMFHEERSTTTGGDRLAAMARDMEQCLATTDALVVRTHAYGWHPLSTEANFAHHLWQSLTSGAMVAVDGVRHASPILATDLAELLSRCYELKLQGLYHIAGAERTSPYRFACELALAAGLAPPRLRPQTIGADDSGKPCLDETSLNSRRARRALEMPLPMLREGLSRFAAQAHDGWREQCQLRSSTSALEQAA